jgi:hypothetical protein
MSKDLSHLPDGYYLLSRPGEPKCLVYLYDHPDFDGVRHVAYGAQDGGGLQPVWDLCDDAILEPAWVVLSTAPMTTTMLSVT